MADKDSAPTDAKPKTSQNSETQKTTSQIKQSVDEDYGYVFFPKRDQSEKKEPDILQRLKCEDKVAWCAKNNSVVQLLLRAMKSKGCPVTLSRHVSCEECKLGVSGGFDPVENQVVVCMNNLKRRSLHCSVLAHELLHAYDNCRAKVDFSDIRHLACTEIRAANLNHCSFTAAMMAGDASPVNIKARHQACVKAKALQSVCMARSASPETIRKIMEEVFPKCYVDLEPIGRRIRRSDLKAQDRALFEGQFYGYDP